MNNTTRVLLAASIVLALGACSKKVKEETEVAETTTPATTVPAETTGRYSPADLDSDSCLRQRTVYFDFDQDTLRPEFQAVMSCHAKYLNDRSESRITLEGNADERGTREYNLALGDRRSNAVKNHLAAQGVSAERISTLSYGKERPEVQGSDDESYSQNRRGVTVVSGGAAS